MNIFKRFKIIKFDGIEMRPSFNVWYIVDSYVRILEITFLNYIIEIPYIWFNKPAKTIAK